VGFFHLRCAASPAHTKLDSPHCLLYNSLQVLSRDRTPFSPLEVSFLAPPQCFFIKKAWTGWGCYFCLCWVPVLGIFHGCLSTRLEKEMVLYKRPESLSIWLVRHCPFRCCKKSRKIGLMGFSSHRS
jgi:hypothetical protein